MAVFTGTQNNDVIDIRSEPLEGSETAHGVTAGAGDDVVYGSSHPDTLQGESGSDDLYGFGDDDALIGGDGDDYLAGGVGEDFLSGGEGNDTLIGGAGNDTMYGESGDDLYVHRANEGVDTINDDKTAAAVPGYGGGDDTIYFPDVKLSDVAYVRPENTDDLWLSSFDDLSDESLDDGVIVEDFYLGGDNTVENLVTADNYQVDLTTLIA